MLLRNATVVHMDPAEVKRADVEIIKGKITRIGDSLNPVEGEKVIDLNGKIIMPGMVCAHHHLYSALSRGMPFQPVVPKNFVEILKYVWWHLDRQLDEESITYSGLAGMMDAIHTGTTTTIDHHASPGFITGSLDLLKKTALETGTRAVLCYEVTDRGGKEERDAGIAENRAILANPIPGWVTGLVGVHASFTVDDDALGACGELAAEFNSGLHIHVAEDLADVKDSHDKYGYGLIERLKRVGALNERSLIAHCTHLTEDEMAELVNSGAWAIHNPRSNMNNQVGYAPIDHFGDNAVLGTDGIGADIFAEMAFAFFKARDGKAQTGADKIIRMAVNNQRLASQLLGVKLGRIEPDYEADIIVLDYDSPTPMNASNLIGHLLFGITSATVSDVMVGGKWVMKNRVLTTVDEAAVRGKSREVAARLWKKL